MLFVANSTPIVDLLSRLNSLRVKRERRFDLPTPESPIRTTAKRNKENGNTPTHHHRRIFFPSANQKNRRRVKSSLFRRRVINKRQQIKRRLHVVVFVLAVVVAVPSVFVVVDGTEPANQTNPSRAEGVWVVIENTEQGKGNRRNKSTHRGGVQVGGGKAGVEV